jgi:hypothetical protein
VFTVGHVDLMVARGGRPFAREGRPLAYEGEEGTRAAFGDEPDRLRL